MLGVRKGRRPVWIGNKTTVSVLDTSLQRQKCPGLATINLPWKSQLTLRDSWVGRLCLYGRRQKTLCKHTHTQTQIHISVYTYIYTHPYIYGYTYIHVHKNIHHTKLHTLNKSVPNRFFHICVCICGPHMYTHTLSLSSVSSTLFYNYWPFRSSSHMPTINTIGKVKRYINCQKVLFCPLLVKWTKEGE